MEAVSVFTAPAVAVPMVGASGAADGVIALDEPDDRLLPLVFVQYTVNVYDVPIVKPVTVIGLAPALVAVMEEGVEVALHCVTTEPPLFASGVKTTEIEVVLRIVGVPIVGASGTPRGVIAGEDAVDAGLVPTELVQVTVKV